ncbi:MAG: DUF2058 domain-containing protein [Desulfamplus sp.]|nr:DUF2058 domain-containing protein [Desulfamplus sp.]
MGNSFQDQLLKAGLVNKKQVNKAKHDNLVSKKKQKQKGDSSSGETSLARKERLAIEQQTRELNRQRNEEKKRHENMAQVRHLIETNHLKEDDHGEPYYFAVGKIIKKLFISEDMTQRLSSGQLAIVRLDDSYKIVPARVARQIAERDQGSLVVFHGEKISV